ncbi:MAG: EamA family transporter [Acidobacteria bacterium]|nr:MAG: EamA family transporter [Acidobacteriota bacterium]PYQ65177.1 MAG: EamA family transporter [Acidobacteriota bacterium]
MSDRSEERVGVLLIASAALLWSTAGVGIKALADPPLKVVFFRSAIAAVVLLLYFRPRLRRLTPGFLAGIACYAACLVSFVTATKWTTAANAIFLQYTGIIWVLLLSPLVVREPLKGRDVAAIAVAFAGMALFFVGKFDPRGRAGDAVALLSGLFFAGLVLSLRRERGVGAEAVVAWGNVVTSAAVLPFVASDLTLTPRSAAVYLFLGVFQLAGAYALFVRGIRHVTATEASLVGMLEPIANPIWVFLFLGEKPEATSLAGGLVVLGAIAWRTLTGAPPEPVAPPD